jgi:hypothetical protein
LKIPLFERFRSALPDGRNIEEIVAHNASAAALFSALGRDPGLRRHSESLLSEMKSLVRAEVADFPAFRDSVRAAAGRRNAPGKLFEVHNRKLLEALLDAGDDQQAVSELLNRNPVYEQIPFIEQVPLARDGETVWVTPVEHPLIQKRASDPVLFEQKLSALEALYSSPHVARREPPRIRILDAILHLSREGRREKPYLPSALKTLEARIAVFDDESIEGEAIAAAETLSRLLLGCERIQRQCRPTRLRIWLSGPDGPSLRQQAAELASSYLAQPLLRQAWLTSQILVTLLAPALWESVRWPGFGLAKEVGLIRNELRTGSYDASELAARIRHLESKGLYVSSLVFPLLHLHPVPEHGPSGGPKKAATMRT